MNTPTPKDSAELLDLPAPQAAERITAAHGGAVTAHEEALRRAHAAKRAAYTAQVAHLAAVQATWEPLGEAYEREMEACRRRLAPGGSARERAAAIKRWAVARMPRKGEGEE
jgi:hypothetical protein